MKIAVSSYSFSQAFRDGRMTILDVIPKAKEMGFDGIEFVRQGQSIEELKELAPKLKAQAEEYGIEIISYMAGADFLLNGLEKQVADLKQEVEIAYLMGATRLRHDSTQGKDASGKMYTVEEALPIVCEGYRQVTEFAAGLGIHTMIENHGYFFQDALRVKKLIENVNHPNFGWLMDMGNFMCADEVSVESVKIAAPMAVHAHAKDFFLKEKGEYIPAQGWFNTRGGNSLRGTIIGHGVVNVKKCLEILKETGYDNWLALEFEGIEDCLMGIKAGLENLKGML
ncbi:MAG: sugar phosphate isomerase/epimerase [Clostridia bacterium]|nr:sugar phosphate isomerase/epimerase [Clostridia bacterium]